jgi:hypothetical protein
MNMLKGNYISTAIRETFVSVKYQFLFVAITLIAGAFFFFYPVISTPGNDVFFQLSITPWWGNSLIALISLATGLMITMQVYVFKKARAVKKRVVGSTAAGLGGGFMASMFAGASCASCVTALFGFLGASNVFLLLEYRWHIMVLSTGVMLVSLHFVSKRINDGCVNCKI